ncbi:MULTISPECIES: YcjX family protein [Larsenimonas]|uniref:YcjX family protein n=1 Tax=Larsenimonas suaedae TaxID=1851019 RepID=A0ABU1GV54_9GAMM|nr:MULTISPECIES: YcjX family protein [Larsenimonas]MCM2971219.1 YcjX family protein [Larsenimonas suaedae]MCM5703327.1 YcjX family protein [Larsenimonas salina]MDR5895928.1 YcjX family protein [Larsenimonas suaedae]
MAWTLPRHIRDVAERGLDRQVRLAVTGLSRAGKTAFLTSLINQLRHAGLDAQLHLIKASREGRLLGAKRELQPDLSLARFPYDEALSSLGETPPRWPTPTRGMSELRLSIRYKSERPSKRLLGETSTLTLDLIDYPGEWLLDLPMLRQSFLDWSQTMNALLTPSRRTHMAEWLEAQSDLSPDQPADEQQLADLSAHYTEGLHRVRNNGGYFIQPGRFLLPGELAGAPVLQFFPLLSCADWSDEALEALPPESLYKTLKARFDHYLKTVITPFYRQHFQRFDRQVVLVDVLTALNSGPEAFDELRTTMEALMQSFSYGRAGLINRLFAPRIDKLAIAATKADHVTPDQHAALVELLTQLMNEPLNDLRFGDIESKAFALASIAATEARRLEEHDAQALSGTTLEGEHVLMFPGEVPSKLPDAAFWARQGFQFTGFRPRPHTEGPLPHLRMDALLDWLLGDKWQ